MVLQVPNPDILIKKILITNNPLKMSEATYHPIPNWSKRPHTIFRWSTWVQFLDGWTSRFAILIPLVGYLILFSDTIANNLQFSILVGSTENDFGFTSTQRLRFMYFGLLLLGTSNFFYRLKKPAMFLYGTNIVDYTKTALNTFTFSDFESIHENSHKTTHDNIQDNSGSKNFLYHDWEWQKFSQAALGYSDSTNGTIDGNWDAARGIHGALLRTILKEKFSQMDTQNRFWLGFCIVSSAIGYLLLIIPSFDLFIKVLLSTFPSF